MDIKEELRICGHQSVVGSNGTELGAMFDTIIKNHHIQDIHFICSIVYTLGRTHGIRAERERRKK